MSNQSTNYSFENLDYIPFTSKIKNNDSLNLIDLDVFSQESIYPKSLLDIEKFPKLSDFGNCLDENFPLISEKKKMTTLFSTKKFQVRGRKGKKNLLGKKHEKYDPDNIMSKIQIHFINFLINIVNDAVKSVFDSQFLINLVKINVNGKKKYQKDFFRHINHKEKMNIKFSYVINCFQKPIKDIIQSDISLKYKNLKSNIDYNRILYDKLSEKSQWFSNFLDMKFIEVFNDYYYNKKEKLDKIDFKGKTINLSEKTKSFFYLLEKEKNLAQSITNLVKDVYLKEINKENNKTNYFVVEKKET